MKTDPRTEGKGEEANRPFYRRAGCLPTGLAWISGLPLFVWEVWLVASYLALNAQGRIYQGDSFSGLIDLLLWPTALIGLPWAVLANLLAALGLRFRPRLAPLAALGMSILSAGMALWIWGFVLEFPPQAAGEERQLIRFPASWLTTPSATLVVGQAISLSPPAPTATFLPTPRLRPSSTPIPSRTPFATFTPWPTTAAPVTPTGPVTKVVTPVMPVDCRLAGELREVDDRGSLSLYLGERLLLDVDADAPGSLTLGEVVFSPVCTNFVVHTIGIEAETRTFLFNIDGSGKKEISAKWDRVRETNLVWAPGGRALVYERLNVCLICARPPDGAPPEGLVRYDLASGKKTVLLDKRMIEPLSWSPDGRWIALQFGMNPPALLLAADGSSLWQLEPAVGCTRLEWVWETPGKAMRLRCASEREVQYYSLPAEADAPPNPPAERVLYRVSGLKPGEVLEVRAAPAAGKRVVGTIPAHGKDIRVTGVGSVEGSTVWLPVRLGQLTGWVDSRYLEMQFGP